ncbi:MAG TPA: arginine--tRNA ligase [Miltoncostaeaceae bacterium]|nr:arginine--tRNA ligase [Miltoncostaeaceae bacterium]
MSDTAILSPIRDALAAAAAAVVGQPAPEVILSPPAKPEMGDLASPLAMTLAKAARRPPREVAEQIATRLRTDAANAAWLADVELAGPGFLNLRLTGDWFAATGAAIAARGRDFGAKCALPRKRILMEYVSANPTGPPHVGHARQAAYGDSLARMLRFGGHSVAREYYINDYGRQMRLFGASIAARYAQLCGREVAVPEDGYRGDYVIEIAEEARAQMGDGLVDRLDPPDDELIERFAQAGERAMLRRIAQELDRFRVEFDTFFSETSLHENGAVAHVVEELERRGDAYRADGALWFRTTTYGDEKDRVLVRADGASTYLAADVAYHLEKASRGDDILIDVLGADHHGYLARLQAIIAAGGYPQGTLETVIIQLVSLMERGEAKKMSKRAGTVVTLGDLLDDIGVDAARFFLVQRSHETALDLDLDLAREQSQENPVYYVQYAHARVCSILRQLADSGDDASEGTAVVEQGAGSADLDVAERALTLRLAGWPEALRDAIDRRAPHRVAAYLIDLARDFHGFYHRCRVVGEPVPVRERRAALCRATAGVISRGLDLLGVEAPESM